MKTSNMLWLKRIVIGTAVAALPQVLLARGPDANDLPPSPPPHLAEPGAAHQPPGMPEMEGPGMMPGQPLLHGIDLTEAQQDAVFDLVHAQIPAQRALEKKAGKALDELHRQSAGEQFNAKQARGVADAYAQAQAQLAFNQAELDSKLRALLTPEQRKQLDAPRHPQQRPANH